MFDENGCVDIGDTGTISDPDVEAYLDCVVEAFAVHVDRERTRHGLWKTATAADQVKQVRMKSDRVLNAFDLRQKGVTTRKEYQEESLEELKDIINYAIFAMRTIKGEFGEQ